MRLFLDANVLFSAARNPDGRAAAVLAFAEPGLCDLLTSPHAVEEARRNLDLKPPTLAVQFEHVLRKVAVCRESPPEGIAWAEAQGLPRKDAPILAAAAEAQADLLVTGDRKHFGALYGKKMRGAEIVTSAVALARLVSQSPQ